jgi:hypothetical protein
MRRIRAFVVSVALLSAREVWPCSVIGPLLRPEELVHSASVVALARATPNAMDGIVEFQIVETLKGSIDVPLIRLDGTLADHDDFNEKEPPYEFVRMDGRRGDCRASTYRQGAFYLLLLQPAMTCIRRIDRPMDFPSLSTRVPLAPTNEQVHGRDDNWVVWVREQIEAR